MKESEESGAEARHSDVVVIGAGPGGSTVAALLARRGLEVTIVEPDEFPRFHIGESLLPASNAVFRELGVQGRIARSGFTVKRGATFMAPNGKCTKIRFDESRQVTDPATFHVRRSTFDEILLDRAVGLGVTIRQGWRVRHVELGDPCRISCQNRSGKEGRLQCRIVVDASGRSGVLASQLGVRAWDAELKNVASFAHFERVSFPDEAEPGDIVVMLRPDLGWLWLIPLDRGQVSVGGVLDLTSYRRLRRRANGDVLPDLIASTPGAAGLFRDAVMIGEERREADFSYSARRYAGRNWFLVGDAGSFLDPVFSTGVHLALSSAWEAAQTISTGWSSGRFAVGKFDSAQHRRYRMFRRLVLAFYDPRARRLLFTPSPVGWIRRSVISVLAGVDPPSVGSRIGLGAFTLAAKLGLGWRGAESLETP